jgi:hypothetical protein
MFENPARGINGCAPGRVGCFRCSGLVVAVLLWAAVALALALPGVAQSANCSLADYGYNGACGPEFEMPAWGDGGGWTNPSKYSTIHLADLTGNGVEELIGRNDDGLEIWTFDTTVGQWRPAVGADGHPEVLTDFRSPLPSEAGPNWNQPQYYRTIQAADLDGPGHGADIIARFPSGVRVYHYTPPAGTKSIDGGRWKVVSENGPFSDMGGSVTDPSTSQTMQVMGATASSPAILIAQGCSSSPSCGAPGTQAYRWTGSGWVSIGPTLAPYEADPRYYLDLRVAMLTTPGPSDVRTPAVIYRTPRGLGAEVYNGSQWKYLVAPPEPAGDCSHSDTDCAPLSDEPSTFWKDCCLGDSPSYYETLGVANLDGESDGDYIIARLRDGLHAYIADVYYNSDKQDSWFGGTSRGDPVLTDLAGDPAATPPGRWASIRTGDILGNGSDQVLAMDGTQLQAWNYTDLSDGTHAWDKVSPSVPLNLGGAMWSRDSSYYSTLQVGDVTGDGHAAVIARGPFGIRTWFYDLHGTSGWTSWLPQDASSYPQFSQGQAVAWDALTAQARQHGLIGATDSSVRALWTGENAPDQRDLGNLQAGLLLFAGCSGQTSANPPTYASCAPPASSGGFTAADWTAVVNETLAEIYAAGQSVAYFAQLNDLRRDTFLAKGAELPAIADSIQTLAGAAGNATEINPLALISTGLGIAGALASLQPEVGIPLAVASYIAGAIPSDTPSLTSPFNGTVSDLQSKFAAAETEADKALGAQSYEVRANWGMLRLMSELTAPTGPWSKIDYVGLKSAMDEGFALWAYQQLLPTLYARYVITGCTSTGRITCELAGAGDGTIGAPPNFTMIGVPPTAGDNSGFHPGTPCDENASEGPNCYYHALPPDIATKVWGQLADTCNYNGDPRTVWTFGCNLGVAPQSSVGLANGPDNGWDFASYCGDYDATASSPCGSGAVHLGRNASVNLSASAALPRGFNVRSATLAAGELLYDPNRRSGTVFRGSGHALGALRLTVSRPGRLLLGGGGDQPPSRLALHSSPSGSTRLSLSLRKVDLAVPAACQQLPASVSLATPQFVLYTTLALSDGHTTKTVLLPALWRCVRDRAGVISGLRAVAPRRLPQRSGLAMSLAGPRTVTSGATTTYTARVRNTRRGPRDRTVSSLWHLVVQAFRSPTEQVNPNSAKPILTREITELRHGRATLVRIPVNFTGSHGKRRCITVTVIADSARPATAQICPSVAAPPPGGLG